MLCRLRTIRQQLFPQPKPQIQGDLRGSPGPIPSAGGEVEDPSLPDLLICHKEHAARVLEILAQLRAAA